MDSTQRDAPSPPSLEDLARRTARALLLPYIIRYASSSAPSEQPREVSVIINTRTGSLTMMEGGIDVESLFFGGKEGRVPASKESIDAMPMVKVAEPGLNCAICLSDFEVGEDAKQMPCNHRYHAGCIDKWLGIQGSCPVCRHRMPVEEDGEKKKESGGNDGDGEAEEAEEEEEEAAEEEEEEEEGDGEGEGEGGGWLGRIPAFVFHIYFAGRSPATMNSGPESGGADESEEGNSDPDMEVDGGSSSDEMDMDIDGSTTP